MRRVAILLAIGGVAAGIALINSTTAAGASLAGTITPGCVLPGSGFTARLSGAPPGAVISFQTSYGGPQANEAGAAATGSANAAGVFAATFAIARSISPGMGMVAVYEFDTSGTSSGVGNFTIGNVAGGCPTPGGATFALSEIIPSDKYSVQLTCDPGVSGDGVFEPTVFMVEVTNFHFPPITLRCNAAPVRFPAVPSQSSVRFHEKIAPAGAVPSADVSAGRPPNTLVVIHNARTAGTVIPAATAPPTPTPTPTPTPPPTPTPTSEPTITPAPTVTPGPTMNSTLTAATSGAATGSAPLVVIGLFTVGLLVIGLGGLLYLRRQRRPGP